MRRPSAQLQHDRREEILDAARRCFARTGFHQTSMQQICLEAGMSPGNLYRYFPSKEAIIAGIAERDRAEVGAELAGAQASPDFFATLEALARHHFVERSTDDVGLCAEMVAESRRNPTIGRIMADFDVDVRAHLIALLQAAKDRGEISQSANLDDAVEAMMLLADGVWWRRAVHADYDPATSIPIFMSIMRFMLLDREQREQREQGGVGVL
jgi:TetR/AcrR family transcriptional repressor of uid operon